MLSIVRAEKKPSPLLLYLNVNIIMFTSVCCPQYFKFVCYLPGLIHLGELLGIGKGK